MLWRPITSYYKRTIAGNHEVRWRDDRGKDCQKTFRTKPEAIGWQEYLRTGEAPEYLPNKPANSISLREFVEIFRVRHCALKAHATGKLYMRDLELWVLPYLGDKLMAKIDDDDIHSWMERLAEEKGPSPKSMANYRKTLHKVFKCAMTWKFEDRYGNRVSYVTKNPVATTKCLLPPEEKEMITWSEAEQRKFLGHVLERNAFVYEVAHLVLGTGLRRGEVAALRPEHLDFDNRHIVVKESFCFHSRQLKHTKSKRIRLVPMNQEIYDLMRKYQDAPADMLIYDGFNTEKFSLKLSRWCQRAKVRKLGIHGLRHTFATSLVRAGIDVKRIQMLLGHSDVTTTMRYVHLVNGDLVGSTSCIEIGISPGAHENRPFPLTWKRTKGANNKGYGEFAGIRRKGLV